MNDLLGIAIVGAGLSAVIQWLKIKFGAEGLAVKLLTILLAIIVGTLYVFLRDTAVWPTILGVLGAASTVYAFFLK